MYGVCSSLWLPGNSLSCRVFLFSFSRTCCKDDDSHARDEKWIWYLLSNFPRELECPAHRIIHDTCEYTEKNGDRTDSGVSTWFNTDLDVGSSLAQGHSSRWFRVQNNILVALTAPSHLHTNIWCCGEKQYQYRREEPIPVHLWNARDSASNGLPT